VKFGNAKQGRNVGRLQSLGVARIRGYVDTFDEVFEFDAHVIPGTDTPLLMSIQDLDSLGYDMRTGTRSLWSHDRDKPKYGEYPIGPHRLHVDGHGRCVIRWDYAAEALFTEAEMRNFRRSYGHKSAETIIKSLEEAGFEDLPADTKDKLNDIARACDPCQQNAVKPRHFSISVKWKDQRFNHLILADVVHFAMETWYTLSTKPHGLMGRASRLLSITQALQKYGIPSSSVGLTYTLGRLIFFKWIKVETSMLPLFKPRAL
jgi:hypothetical protein